MRKTNDETIPDDVKSQLMQFARAGISVAVMLGETYLR